MSKKTESLASRVLSHGVNPWEPALREFIEYVCPGIKIPEELNEVVEAIQKRHVLVARKMLKASQLEMATMLGVTKRHIQMLEDGSRKAKLTTRLAVECLLRINGEYKTKLYSPVRIGGGLYLKLDLVEWEDAIEEGGFYFDRARYLGLSKPVALIVAEEKFPYALKSEVLEARGAYHEHFKNAEADLVTELAEANTMEEVPGI